MFFLIGLETEDSESLERGKTGQFPREKGYERADRGGQSFPNVFQCRGSFGGGVGGGALQSEKNKEGN